MKRYLLVLSFLALVLTAWSQTPVKKKDIKYTPHDLPKSIANMPTEGVPLATQQLEATPSIKTIPLLTKRSAVLPATLKVITADAGLPTMIEGILPTPQYSALKTVEERVTQYLGAIGNAMQIKKPANEFVIKSIETDDIGQTHVRMQQVLGTVPVWGSQILVHEKNGQVILFNGVYFPTPSVSALEPTVLNAEAETTVRLDLDKKVGFKKLPDAAKENIGGEQLRSELVIFHKNDKRDAERLAWHVTAYPTVLHRYEYFVDAQNGQILDSYHSSCTIAGHIHGATESLITELVSSKTAENTEGVDINHLTILTLDGALTATALDLLNVNRTINTYQVGTRYYMLDGSRTMFNIASSTLPGKPVGGIQTLDANNTDEGPYFYVSGTTNVWNNPKAVSSHYNAGAAYTYYKNTFGRNSINGKGGTITSFINVTDNSQAMDNAYWNGEAMFYGNGDQAFLPLARGLDVAGHEISHGVIQNTANLKYQDEPGALNESFADIFGTMIDRDDWQIGEDVMKGRTIFPTGFLRDMANPHNGGTNINSNGWQPAHVSEKYTGSQDNGGVHTNSGITNYAYYLFATNGSVGKAIAEQVFYRALSVYMVASSKFIDCRAAVEQSCKDLYANNPAVLTAAQNAFGQVGIGSGGSTTGAVYQQDLKVNPGSDWVVYTTNDQSKLMLTNGTGSTSLTLSTRGVVNKPSITDNGSRIYFIGSDKKMYAINMNYTTNPPKFTESLIEDTPTWNNVAVSKDGTKIAGNDGTDTLWVYTSINNPTGVWKTYKLYNPTFTAGVDAGAVQYSDALEWDHFGNSVLYDAFNKIKGQGTDAVEFWDVGSIEIWSKQKNTWLTTPKIEKLFTSLPEGTSIADPTYAKNSPYIVAFDFVDESVNPTEYYVLAANTQTGASTQATTGIYQNNTYGYPSFSRLDDRILFTNTGTGGVARLGIISLASSKIEPTGTPAIFKTDAQLGNWFANGTRTLTSIGELDKTAVSISPNPFTDMVNVQISSEITDNGKVEIFDLLGRTVKTIPISINIGKNAVSVETQGLQAGTYLLKVSLGDKSLTSKIVKF